MYRVRQIFFWKILKKEKLLNIFSNVFLYLKVQSFWLIMENNFVQMTTWAGQAVVYTIGPIYKHIIDRVGYCLAKRGSHLNEFCFPLLTGRIVLSNKRRNLRKYSVVFFLTIFRKKGIWRTLYIHSY